MGDISLNLTLFTFVWTCKKKKKKKKAAPRGKTVKTKKREVSVARVGPYV
jgi:hypothetical protein